MVLRSTYNLALREATCMFTNPGRKKISRVEQRNVLTALRI